MVNATIDQAHTVHYGTGYLFKQVKPRLAMCMHLAYDEMLVPEIVAGIREHYDGLFQFGAPDVVVVNVTKEAIWTRKAAFPDDANPAQPSPREAIELYGVVPGQTEIAFPKPRHTIMDVQEPFVREQEIDPKKYYPPDVYREPIFVFPDNLKIDLTQMAAAKLKQKFPDAKTPLEAITKARAEVQQELNELDAMEAQFRQASPKK